MAGWLLAIFHVRYCVVAEEEDGGVATVFEVDGGWAFERMCLPRGARLANQGERGVCLLGRQAGDGWMCVWFACGRGKVISGEEGVCNLERGCHVAAYESLERVWWWCGLARRMAGSRDAPLSPPRLAFSGSFVISTSR